MNDTTTDSLLTGDEPMSTGEYEAILSEIEEQPAWRGTADKEMDYADGNQLDSELLRRQQSLGIPPAVEDNIGPALLSLQGFEARTRTDWRVTPNGQQGGQDVAAAINFKLNEAERQSKADKAMSEAFRPMIGCGIGWVEVGRESDPFGYPYRVRSVHRNEIHWDMTNREIEKWRFLRRQQWVRPERLVRMFRQHAELIGQIATSGPAWWQDRVTGVDGGVSTGLQNAWNMARAWTWDENRWYNLTSREVCVAELWYRRWADVMVLNLPDGRIVELDESNPAHLVAAGLPRARLRAAVVPRVRRAFWLGPHLLADTPSPFPHRFFPYVPFIAFQEDMTGIPFGYVRGMKYAQDAINSGTSKLRWGMSVVRVERTKGAVAMTDAQLRAQVARPDGDVVLDAEHMAKPGAKFEVKRDYTLTEQHFRMLDDSRATIERSSAITSGFIGRKGSATSGVQEQTQVEQSNQSIADVMDHFRDARTLVGEQLMALVVQDIGEQETAVVIEGDALTDDRTVVLNKIERDGSGYTYLSNDLQRTRLLCGLEDVPSTSTHRGQQLQSMSEAVKSLPPQYQAAAMPFMTSLMDVPFKRELVEAMRAAGAQESPEQVQQRIQQAVAEALTKAGHELKARELDMKERKTDAEIRKLMADAVQVGVQAAFAAMQGGAQVAQMPMIAPIADAIMQGAGYRRPAPGGDDPNFPVPTETAAMNIKSPYIQGQGPEQPPDAGRDDGAAPPVERNTSPAFPARAPDGNSPMQGIETATTADNLV